MQILLIFVVTFVFLSSLVLLALPFLRPPRDAERMLTLVRSARQDRRHLSVYESLTTAVLSRLGKVGSHMGDNTKVKTRLAEAGMRGVHTADNFFAAQIIGLLGGAALGSFMADNTIFWVLAGTVVGFMAPDFWLTASQKRRRERIRKSIPDAVDLLVICVDAGLGLDQAILRVGHELSISHPDLNDEFTRLSLERQAGTPRLEAFRRLAERTRIEELSDFVNMLAETDRFGTPIVKALSAFSEDIRMKRRQRAEEAAAKTKIKIIFPLVICIFPCIFIVLLAPAILSIAKGMKGMGQ